MRLVLAGAQTPANLDKLILGGAPSVLLSYHYMMRQGDRGEAVLRRAKEAGMWVLIDSGAFTYKEKYMYARLDWTKSFGVVNDSPDMPEFLTQKLIDERRAAAGDKSMEEIKLELREFHENYLKWLQKFGHYGDAFAEFDMDMFMGDEIWEWRQQILDAGLDCEPIITPHYLSSKDDVERIVEKMGFRYLGVEGGRGGDYYRTFFSKWMPLLKKYRVRTHGWATTDNFSIQQIPFYSVDSTTWNMGMQYGTTYLYQGNFRMKTLGYEYKHQRQSMRALCDEYGVDFEKFLKDDGDAVNQFNACSWIRYSKDLDAYVSNAYWLTDDEKAEEIERTREQYGTSTAVIRHDPTTHTALQDIRSRDFGRYCNTCYLNAKCPAYEANATCSIMPNVAIGKTVTMKDMLDEIVSRQFDRLNFAFFAERVSGVPDEGKIDRSAASFMSLMKQYQEIVNPRESRASVTIHASTPMSSTSADGSPQPQQPQGGILSQLFAGLSKPAEAPTRDESIEIVAEPQKARRDD
jgi:hypothetical protein